ncbi:MAG: NTP transferase domain-containing protein [Deltaproteobacteria bacterium]|nr:NTP transferase domain-containing protein [Deltaproteobacteria bacterium]
MQIIIMAAGRGRRLGSLTADIPKALIEVAEEPLVQHSLRFARQAGGGRVIVVGGFYYEQLEPVVRALDSEAVLVENTNLHAGNLLSLVAGMTALQDDQGFLLMNCDHIYPRQVAQIVENTARDASDITAFCDFDRELCADDMKVKLQGRRVVSMAKTLEEWDAGYVGMTWIPDARRGDYDRAVGDFRATKGDDNPVERVLVHLAESEQRPAIADISGHGWHEVDEPHERERAEAALRSQRT